MRSHRLDSNKHAGIRTRGNCTAAVRARVEQALRELPLAGHDRERIAAQLLRHALFRAPRAGLNLDSEFFDFRARVGAVVEHFAAQGLTLEGYLKAIVERPSLLTRSPATVIAQVEAVAAHFRPHGLTLRRYLGMALQQPQLFYQSPTALIANFETVVGHFAPHGLTLKDYLRAAVQRPTLFTQRPATIQSKIETVAKHFAPQGLELTAYLRASASQPSLFYQKPSTLIGNIEAVTRHFAPYGLTLRSYLGTALRQPQLFYQSPTTLIANVETVVGYFAPHGLTLPDYLAAALREPGLFTSKPATIRWKIEAVADYFAPHGLTVPAYLRAAIRNPRLFSQAPGTIQSNIETVACHFTAHGLALGAYVRAALRQPQLFSQAPATICSNIESVAAHFAKDGLTLGDYLAAALRQPQLFARAPASMIRHIGCVIDMQAQGLVTFPGQGDAPAAQRLYPLFAYLVRNPLCMTLSDDNYALRMTYAQITGRRPSGMALLRRTRHGIEQDLAAARSRKLPPGSRRKMKRSAATARKPQAGFSLIFMSIFITVAMMVFVAFLPGREAGDLNQKTTNNVHKLERVEEAMRGFMAMYGRRPCPADGQYAENTANFGLEAATPGTCTGGTPSAPLGPDAATGHVVGGVIPTRSLGLPDDYQFDDFGRRITYVVDTRATQNASCITMEALNTSYKPTGKGGVYIYNATPANGGTQIDQTMYAYIIHGATGYGAFPSQGSTVGGRINSGSTDTDMQTNAGVDSGFNYSTANFTNMKVKRDRVAPTSGDTGFDDLVWYRPDIKNYCCLGSLCAGGPGFRIDGLTNGAGNHLRLLAVGDLDGDGINDFVVATDTGGGNGSPNESSIYVVFGQPKSSSATISVANLHGASTGFRIDGMGAANSEAFATIADVNGDGKNDLIIAGWGKIAVIFGGPKPWPDSFDATTLTNGYQAAASGPQGGVNIFPNTTAGWIQPAPIYVGNVNNGAYKDVVMTGKTYPGGPGNSAGVVIFGSADWAAWSGASTTASLDGTNGFQIITSSDNSGATGTAFGGVDGVGAVDNDAYDDIVISAVQSYSGTGSAFVLWGRASGGGAGQWPTGNPAQVDIAAELAGTGATRIYDSYVHNPYSGGFFGGCILANLTGGSTNDIICGSMYNPLYVKQSSTSRLPATYDMNAHVGSGVWRIKEYGVPQDSGAAWDFISALAVGDVNGDGNMDLLVGCSLCSYNSRDNSGTVYVFLGPVTGWPTDTSISDWSFDGTHAFHVDGAVANEYSGRGASYIGIAGADMTGDGKPEIISSATRAYPGGSPGGNSAPGSIYVYFNKSWTGSVDLNDINR